MLCPRSAHALPPRYDKLPVLLPELVFSWVPHQYFLAPPGSMGRTVAAKHVQARYERGERGGRRQSAAEKELGTSVDEGMLLMATAPRHVHPHVHRTGTPPARPRPSSRSGPLLVP